MGSPGRRRHGVHLRGAYDDGGATGPRLRVGAQGRCDRLPRPRRRPRAVPPLRRLRRASTSTTTAEWDAWPSLPAFASAFRLTRRWRRELSRNCERGSYIIPRAAWAPLKELVVAAYNAHRDRLFAQAVALCDEVASLRSAKRGTSVRDALHALRLEQKPSYRTPRPAVAAVRNEELCFILKLWDDKLPRRPKRKLFAHLPARATELTLLDCSLIFKNDSRTSRLERSRK